MTIVMEPHGISVAAEPVFNGLEPVTFERDLMAVLSKGGCNAGTCHGNINGKGGFFLSLRGQDPAADYRQIVHAAAGRRVDRLEPSQSFLLMKATSKVAHQGGKRFEPDSAEFGLLQRWIEEGMVPPVADAPRVDRLEVTPEDIVLWAPQNESPLQVTAHFTDGSSRDVTGLAVYEPDDPLVTVTREGVVQFDQPGVVTVLVRYLDGQFPARIAMRSLPADFVWSAPEKYNAIDGYIFARLEQLRINPAPLAADNVFLRRVYLDLLGVPPTEMEAKQFVADTSSDKRARVVDALLERPEFATHWALKWSDVVRNEEKTLDATGVEKLHTWMRDWFAADRPLNEFAAALVSAHGSTYENPPANYWRAHREPFVRSETTAQVFLAARLQCARCHNHPFDRWSQDEYYEWASLFSGIDYEVVENKRRDNLDSHEFIGEQIVKIKAEGTVNNARTGKPAAPRLLGETAVIEGDRLEQLAAWLSSSDNRMFARAQANRIWFHLMGAGLVDPVDDIRPTNPASHPKLLDALADELVTNGYRLKHLCRMIVLSRTYQSSAELNPEEISELEYNPRLFARVVTRRLDAEKVLDAQSQVLGVPARFEGYPPGTRAGEIAGVERVRRKFAEGDDFLRQFGKPERLLACECERGNDPTLGQALTLIGGDSLNRRLRQTDNRISQLMSEHDEIRDVIESLFWTALTRPPTEEEVSATLELIEQGEEPRAALEDLTWALLNAKEMIFRN